MADDYDEEYDDEYDDVEEFDDDIEEVDEYDDDVDEIEEVDEDEEEIDKGRRQLQRGRAAQLSDRLTGGAARPGEESIKKSPFFMLMMGAIAAAGLIGLVLGVMVLNTSEQRAFAQADDAFKAQQYPQAEELYDSYLMSYPNDGTYTSQARIGKHKARVNALIAGTSFKPGDVTEGLKELKELISVGQDLEGWEEERENVYRFCYRIAYAGAAVAKAQINPECLEASEEAETLMPVYAPPDGVPSANANKVKIRQDEAQAAILKKTILDEQLKEIRGLIDVGDTFKAFQQRADLISEYPILSEDKEVTAVLGEILEKEKTSVTAEKPGTAAQTQDVASSSVQGTAITLRTQATSDQVSQNRQVFAVGLDSCFALDSETGQPNWKRNIGMRPPFMPASVDESRLLVYQTNTKELVMLSKADGSLIWRQQIDSRPTGRPLILAPQVYITTAAGELWQISLDNGKAITRVQFGQSVVGPPARAGAKRDHFLIAGDEGVVYTLTTSPLECVEVSYTGHALGSIESPILQTGGLHLMAVNGNSDNCTLKMLQLDDKTKRVSVLQEIMVPGLVRDECFLRGKDLFVPSSPQRVTAFSVSDENLKSPLALTASNQLPNAREARVFLLNGPGGRLWMASDSLREFKLNLDSLELQPEIAAPGEHLRPIRFENQNLYLTTNQSYSNSIFYSKVEQQGLKGAWRTVIGTNIVAVGPSDSAESMIAVGDFGSVFRIPVAQIGQNKFISDSITEYQVPEKLRTSIGGLKLRDGRVAAYCGGPDPSLWTFTMVGQLEQRWKLQGAPNVPPVSLDDGVVVASSGRLEMTANRAGRVSGYQAWDAADKALNWKSLVAVSPTQVLAINSNNQAIRAEYRTSPSRRLVEVARSSLPEPIENTPAPAGEFLVATSTRGNLLIMSTATLEVLARQPLGELSSRSPLVAGNRAFVHLGQRELRTFEVSQAGTQTGTMPLNGRFVVSPPVALSNNGGFVACLSDGDVVVLDANGNPTAKVKKLGQGISRGPIAVGNSLIAIGTDGTLYRVEDVLQ